MTRVDLITTAEAARRLGIKPVTVRWLITTGVLPARRLGRDWMIDPADLAKARDRRRPGRPKEKG